VQPKVILRAETAPALDLLKLALSVRFQEDSRTDRRAVGLASDQPDEKPGVRGRRFVSEEKRAVVDVIDKEVELSRMKNIAHRTGGKYLRSDRFPGSGGGYGCPLPTRRRLSEDKWALPR